MSITYGEYVVKLAKADLCKTQSRGSHGKNYVNKYNLYFAGHGGIDSKGHMPRPYGYVPGHCTNGRNYTYVKAGLEAYVPVTKMAERGAGYFWNAHQQWDYWKKYHKSWCTTDPHKAVKGATAYKGQKKRGKLTTPTHTCIFIKAEGDYVWTVDFNVGDGKGHNNGTVHKRHKSYFNGFVNFPKLTKKIPEDKIALWPMTNHRVSCKYNQGAAHIACSTGKPCDYPTDLVGKDSGRSWAVNRFGSKMIVLRRYTAASHAIWMRTLNKVFTPSGYGYLYVMSEHQDNNEMKAVGKKYAIGEKMFREAANGNATGNHLHMSFAFSMNKKLTSKTMGSGWKKNSKKAWVLKLPNVTNIKIGEALFSKKP